MKFEPPLYEFGSAEYEGYISKLTDANSTQNRRNRYVNAKRTGQPNPFGDEIPEKPTKQQLAVIAADRQWKEALRGQSDHWWFRRINKAIEENFYRAKVSCLLWWELCQTEDLDANAWHARFEGYDFERDLFADLEIIEYAIHCCGFPPPKARLMVFDASDRRKWRVQKSKIYECGCGEVVTDLNYTPVHCPCCGDADIKLRRPVV